MADARGVKGLDELHEFFREFTLRMAGVTRGGLRAGMEVVQPVAQSNVHPVSGELAAGLEVGTRQEGSTVIAYLHATGPGAFRAKWVEYGTQAHLIKAKTASALSFGGGFAEYAEHPGAKPHAFMRPALDSQASAAVAAAAEYMRSCLAAGDINKEKP